MTQTKGVQTNRGYDIFELLSALQKDIRRGKEYPALFWAVELESFEPNGPTMVWNRLKKIASEDIGCANPIMPVIIETLEKQYDKARKKGDDSCRLYLSNAVIILARSPKTRITDDLLTFVYGRIQHEDKKLSIPDYALDKHTLRGRKMGRGYDDFFKVGAKLANEAFLGPNPYTQEAKRLLETYGKLKPVKSQRRKSNKKVEKQCAEDR